MPILRVEVNVYQCTHCGYKWINWVDGKDGPVPTRCAKCKRTNWDQGSIEPQEVGARRRISGLGGFYRWSDKPLNEIWDERLVEQFLNLSPRPSWRELNYVLKWGGQNAQDEFVLSVNPQEKYRRSGWIPDPDRPGYAKYDEEAYNDLLASEAEKRKELMRQAIRARGVEPIDSSPNHIPWHNPDDVKLAKGILKLGKHLEEAGKVPKRKICARLVKDLSDKVDKSDIERLCPPEWKQEAAKVIKK